jgi:hypothetical protein
MHLESCTGSSGQFLDSCSNAKAQRILAVDCSTLQNNTRQTTSNLFDWLGNLLGGGNNEEPHGWDPSDPSHGGDPSANHDPSAKNNNKCYCDSWAKYLNDCCHWCQEKCGYGGEGNHEDPSWNGGGIEEPGSGYGNQQGGWCAHQGGNNWRRCRQCGWQFCLSNGQWAPCQKPQNNDFNSSCGGAWCGGDGYCHY